LQSTTVAAAAELGVNPLAGFSITFWTELIGAPPYYASILHVTTTGEADGVVGAPVVPQWGRAQRSAAARFWTARLNGRTPCLQQCHSLHL
jgi:hypothetical protein